MATQRIPFTQPIESRTGSFSKDSYSSNCVFEGRNQKSEFIKRPGLVLATQITPVTPPTIAPSQGLSSLNSQIISVINNTVYKTDPTSYVTTTLGSTSTSTSQSYFVKSFLETYLFFHNKVTGYLLNSSYTLSTPASIPSGPYASGIVYLDNYVFIGTTSNNRIYNSNLGDPTTWDALGYISFSQTSDNLVGICKHLNYLIGFGQSSMQFFYDAANAAPASPLSISGSYTNEVGCANGDSIVSTDNTVIWIGTTKSNGRSIFMLEGTAPIKASTPNIDKFLEADDLSKVTAYCYKFSGHTLYILTLHTSNETLVYDLNEKTWYRWTQYAIASSNQPNPGVYSESYFRPSFYTEVNTVPYALDDDVANLYYFDVDTYQDNGQDIYCRTVTDLYDNGITKRKFYGRLEIIGDKVAGTMQIRHTGNDYVSWSDYRSVNLNASRSQIYLSGADRRRAWEFLCTSNVPLRMDAAELDFRIGEMDQEQNVGGG